MIIKGSQDPFLSYFHRELTYLRNAGALFAEKHPKIARRLELADGESPDPHTERLLESFAFLTARLSQEIDDRLPQIASALLGVLFPQLINPIPAMAIAQFQVDPTKGTMTSGFDIPRETPLTSEAEEGLACRFRTAYPVTLWPIEVTKAEFVERVNYPQLPSSVQSNWLIRLRLTSQGLLFSELDLSQLTFHIRGDNVLSYHLYEAIFAQTNPNVFVAQGDKVSPPLPRGSINPVGLEPEDCVVPSPSHSNPAFQAIQEYFHFPERFLFFNINNLDRELKGAEETVDILIPVSPGITIDNLEIGPENFLLGCTPIVNLFPKITDPIRLDHRKIDYRVSPDQRRERTTEIHSIIKVMAALDDDPEAQTFKPYFSFSHEDLKDKETVYWLSRRVPTDRRETPGTDVLLSFVDTNFDPKMPPLQTVYAHTLCTNRFLAEQLPANAVLEMEDKAPVSRVVCLDKPVSQVYSPTDGETLWQLISHLSINHLSITQGPFAVKALKEMLRLYAGPASNYRHEEIEGILGISSRPIVRRVGNQAWRGFVEGLEVVLNLNERLQSGTSSFLLASVLRKFFAQQVAINSFVQLTIFSSQRQSEWMTWQPLPGEQILL